MYKAPEPMLITVKHHGKTFTAEIPWDSSLDEVFETITGLLVLDGWSESSVQDHIIEKACEIEDYRKKFDTDEESTISG